MLRSSVFRIICVALAPGSPWGGWCRNCQVGSNGETGRSTQRRCIRLRAPRFSRFDLSAAVAALPESRARARGYWKRCQRPGSAQRRCIGLRAPPPCRRAAPGVKRRRNAAGQRLRNQAGRIVPVDDFDVQGGTTTGDDGNRAFPRAARETRARQSRVDVRSSRVTPRRPQPIARTGKRPSRCS